MRSALHSRQHRRSGAALIYVAIIMVVMMAFCSLAVDLGRYEVSHSQLYNAAVAAARAGAAAIPNGTATSVTTAATNAATKNTVDGKAIAASQVTVQFINWTSSTDYSVLTASNFSQANAVRVSISYTVPLVFAQALGYANKQAVENSTAMVTTQTDSPYVSATGNPYLAGEPTGTLASQADPGYEGVNVNPDHPYPNDVAGPPGTNAPVYSYNRHTGVTTGTQNTSGEPYCSPVQVAFTVTPGSTITITNVSGSDSYDGSTAPWLSAEGQTSYIVDDAAANGISEHGIADVFMPCGAMNAVFLSNSLPDNIATVPPVLNFSTQAEQDYVGLQPKLQQPFFVGNGQTSGGVQQQIIVPAGATKLFLGVMDGWEWNNNQGGFNATVTQTTITTVQ